MDEDTATRFVSSLVKSIQALCNGYIDFSSSIEVVGHIHLNIDRNKKLDYVLTEEVSKSVSEGATVFASHSYHSHPPPSASSKTSGDASNQNRRKSQVSRDNDPLSITSLPPEVPNTSRSHSSSRVEENSDSSGSANYSQDFTPVKSENNRTSCQVQESLDRRRKGVPLSHTHRTQSPAAKRPRNHDTSSAVQNPGFDVIEIKEEPDDEPSVYFGDNSSSNMAAGQADIQTPDFSNVVMESLDRVGQIEGTQLVAGGDSGQQHQPFPVMLHTNPGMPSSSSQGPGPSLNPQSTASTSGVGLGHTDNDYLSALLDVGPLRQQRQVSYQPGFMFNDTNRFRGGGKNRNPQSSFWRNMSEERRALEREKSRLRMQMSRARRKEQEQYFADNNRQTLDQNSRVFMYGDVEIGVIYSENETISVQLASDDPKASTSGRRPSGTNWRRGKYKNYTEEDLMKAVNMVLEGYSYKKTTELTGVPCSTITDRMSKMNLSRKPKRKEDPPDVPGLKKLAPKSSEFRVLP